MVRVVFLLTLVLCNALCASGQTAADWQQTYNEITPPTDDDDSQADWESSAELLQHLSDHPLNLNQATRSQLLELPFLSEQQVMDIEEHRHRYGPIRSVAELRMIRSLDFQQLALLPCFVVAGEPAYTVATRSVADMLRRGHTSVLATARVPFYHRRGDHNGYAGYRYAHSLRIEHACADSLRMGLVAAQDAGEPFMAGINKWGYDTYSAYLQLRGRGMLDNLVVGRYRVSTGMGLVLSGTFAMGKLAALQNLGRATRTLRPHASRSEAAYMQGAGATLRLSRRLSLTAFASHRAIDATLNADGTAATLVTDGYHRTTTEMQKKHNTHLTAAGASLTFDRRAWSVAANAVYTHADRSLQPDRTVLYRRHYAHGSHFLNASVSYAFNHPVVALRGETATDAGRHVATINSLSLRPADGLTLVALQRFYSYRYTSLYARSFCDGTRVQNESGLMLGATWRPHPRWQLQTYADYAYAPWPRYQTSQASTSIDLFLQATRQHGHWTCQGRYRARLRQRDNKEKTALTDNDSHHARLSATYASDHGWSLRAQADATFARGLDADRGWMVSHQATARLGRLRLWLTAAYFHTTSYQSRIYLYEHMLTYQTAFNLCYGEGIRTVLTAQADMGRRLRLSARVGRTCYFDRSAIGTGLQQIAHSSRTDLDLQLGWRL